MPFYLTLSITLNVKARVEAPMTDHLRDFAPNLEKYKVVQFFHVLEDRNKEDCKFCFGNFIL